MALDYRDAVQWYYSFARFDAPTPAVPDALKLARIQELLAQLGNPHTQFPSILIAGTKGKGSTAALVESILHTAGYRTGLFTSPHLHSFRERIRVNQEPISKIHVVQGTTLLQTHAASFSGVKFFEWVTALAFDYFARQRVEIAVVEVGLGGRLDSTNVLTPRVSVITPISYDHMDILGDTLAKIASEKAGIIKPEVPVVVAPQAEEAFQVIQATAERQAAPLVDVPAEWTWEPEGTTLDAQLVRVQSKSDAEPERYHLPLLGPHQRINLVTALATIQTLRREGWKIPHGAIRRGVERVEWQGRFELLARPVSPVAAHPAGDDTSGTNYIVADGAHNRASAHELRRTLDEAFPNVPVHFVFGASSDKDIHGMLDELLPRAASIVLTQAHHARAADPLELARLASPYPVMIHTASTLAEALARARHLAAPGEVICITGSLFIVAEARAQLLHISNEDQA